MFLILAAVGINLAATAVSWRNGRRTAEAQAQIRSLEADLARIRAADAARRREMIGAYLDHLTALIHSELEVRYSVEADLTLCLDKARSIQKQRFGAREGVTVRRATLELELGLSQVKAEVAYLRMVRDTIAQVDQNESTELPSPGVIELPVDFPRDGAFVQFDQGEPRKLHGYSLRIADRDGQGAGRGALMDVDHQQRTAQVSVSRCPLLEANLSDDGQPLRARVVRRDTEGVHLEVHGVGLLLPVTRQAPAEWLTPECDADVYPDVWTLDELRTAGESRPLPVRLNPRVDGNRVRWSPIRLAIAERQRDALADAFDRIEKLLENDPPWRVHVSAADRLAFSMGSVTLETVPNLELMAFELKDVQLHSPAPEFSVKVHAELWAFIPGSEDDQEVGKDQFNAFVAALHEELGGLRSLVMQRRTALRLRKLSLIYRDQEDHLRGVGSTGLVVCNYEAGGRAVIALLVGGSVPSWVQDAIKAPSDSRVRACNAETAWDVKSASWVDQRLGMIRLELSIPRTASLREINPYGLCRLELQGEGSQQQTLSRALERTIVGRFASTSVHSTLLGLACEPIPNETLGSDAVERLLASDTDVVAIWGPPGTGKTTTLVKWLLSILPEGDEERWPSILITAPTHVAVTKLVTDLLHTARWLTGECVRYAGAERVAGTGLEAVWHQQLLVAIDPAQRGSDTTKGPAQRWARVLATREGREAAARWLLGPRHVHAVTCVGMARRDHGLWERTFDIAIIDEAGKAFGAELMIPASVARRVVMVGDHNQLPPTVTSDALDPRIGYRLPFKEVQELLERNTFQDIFDQLPSDKKGMLTKQYRMHADIGSLVSRLFYEGKLTSHRNEPNWSLTRRRVVFLDFTNVGQYRHQKARTSDSQENLTERQALHALLERLSQQNGGRVKYVLVVCPYEAQRTAVASETQGRPYGFKVEVTTVDAVQGGEADLVILLMTRSHGRVQFLLDRHRLNVALSRARDAIIILGHRHCLTKEPGGPVDQLIDIGLQDGTLDLVSVLPNDPHWWKLACRVVPCAQSQRRIRISAGHA